MLGAKKVDDPRNFGAAEIDEQDAMGRGGEEPSIPKSSMALIGNYEIKESANLYNWLLKEQASKSHSYDEFSLTQAIECMISQGVKFKAFKVDIWFDCGKKDSLLESNAILLKKFGGNNPEAEKYKNSIIISPVSIGTGCVIQNAVIGPNVAIGD